MDKSNYQSNDDKAIKQIANSDLNTTQDTAVSSQDVPNIQQVVFAKLGIANSTNPFVCIFHILFKVLAITSYLFSGLLLNSVMIFLSVAIFSVLDFWVVKNISGRFIYKISGRFTLVVGSWRRGKRKVELWIVRFWSEKQSNWRVHFLVWSNCKLFILGLYPVYQVLDYCTFLGFLIREFLHSQPFRFLLQTFMLITNAVRIIKKN